MIPIYREKLQKADDSQTRLTNHDEHGQRIQSRNQDSVGIKFGHTQGNLKRDGIFDESGDDGGT